MYWFKKTIVPKDDPTVLLGDGDSSWEDLEPNTQEQKVDAHERARKLLEAIEKGERPELANNWYYSMSLSGASGRVMVRDWMEGQFGVLARNVFHWFDDLKIIRRDGQGFAPSPKFMAVLGATVSELKYLSPPFVAKMWRVALTGGDIPEESVVWAVNRFRIDLLDEKTPNHARMGLIRAYHVRKERNSNIGGEITMRPELNEDHPNPAYHCGRLMSVLADLQYAAQGDVGAGVIQRYYAAASATPALVFGRLIRLAQFHLAKLEYAKWYQDKLMAIWNQIKNEVPETLTLHDQSLFAMGFYQQMAKDRAEAVNAKTARVEVKKSNNEQQ